MALRLQRCGEWSHFALQVVPKPPRGLRKERVHKTRLRAQNTDESLRLRLIDKESGNGSSTKLPLADRWKGVSPRNFVAAPRYSSLLKLTRRRRHELRMETRDRVFLSISDWVSRRVNDPLVEIDPVTVNKVILEEQQGGWDDADTTVATKTSPSVFGYLPPGFPKSADKAAIAAAIVLLLAALVTAAILALRGKKTSESVPVAAAGQESNGSVTNGGARQEMEGERSAGWQESAVSDQAVRKQPAPIAKSSMESQTTDLMPIPQYSTALDRSDLPLPPSFGASTTDKKVDSPSSGEIGSSSDADEPVVSFVTLPSEGGADGVDHWAPLAEAVEMAAIDDAIIGSHGIAKGHSDHEVAAELQSAVVEELSAPAIEEMIASASLEELTKPATESEEDLLELSPGSSSFLEEIAKAGSEDGLLELGPGSISEPVVPGGLPSASESLEQISVGMEYILMGESDSLSPVGQFHAPAEPIAALPTTADVGVPVDSILVYDSAAQPPSEELSSEKIDVSSASVQEEVPAGSYAEVVEERRKAYAQAIEKVLPAVSVGAGVAALSSFSGVDGALQVVGALAAASFVKDVLWAGPRQQLLDEVRNIKSHQQLLQFLKDKDIFPQSWSH